MRRPTAIKRFTYDTINHDFAFSFTDVAVKHRHELAKGRERANAALLLGSESRPRRRLLRLCCWDIDEAAEE